jgi:hypothetical protein
MRPAKLKQLRVQRFDLFSHVGKISIATENLSEVIDIRKLGMPKFVTNKSNFFCSSHIEILVPLTSITPEVDSASNRNEYQESFLGVKTAGA